MMGSIDAIIIEISIINYRYFVSIDYIDNFERLIYLVVNNYLLGFVNSFSYQSLSSNYFVVLRTLRIRYINVSNGKIHNTTLLQLILLTLHMFAKIILVVCILIWRQEQHIGKDNTIFPC